MAVAVLGGLGCTEPQMGVLSATWCHPTAAEGMPYVMLDDLEDGDELPCDRAAGHWSVQATGTVTPVAGEPIVPVELTGSLAVARPSLRALHLHGTVEAGGYADLLLPLASMDLSGYPEIDFWARSDNPEGLKLHVLVETATVTDGDYFAGDVDIEGAWANSVAPYSLPLLGYLKRSDGQMVSRDDLQLSTSIVFQLLASSASEFGFWIDDVQLKRPTN